MRRLEIQMFLLIVLGLLVLSLVAGLLSQSGIQGPTITKRSPVVAAAPGRAAVGIERSR